MKLVMFTPVSRRSAIARVASLAIHELRAQGHAVTVVAADSAEPLEARPDLGPDILSWTDDGNVHRACIESDVAVYQIGDHLEFHRGCLRWLQMQRGIVCLHDLFLGDLFVNWCASSGFPPETVVETWYGPDVAATYRARSHAPDFAESTMRDAPMVEWMCSKALAVLTHSSWGIDRVLASTPGPVAIAPLPYQPSFTLDSAGLHAPARRWRILTVGHVNANKRVDVVIKAIAARAHLRDRTTYDVVGPIEPSRARELADLALVTGVRLNLVGSVGERALRDSYLRADVVVALRNPALEAASASVVEAMWLGKPIVVSDSGSYAELPSDCVHKVDPDNEIDGTAHALEVLLGQREVANALGQHAAAHARSAHAAAGYAATLIDLARAALPLASPIEAIDSVVRTYASWGLPDVPDPFLLPSMMDLWSAMP